LQQVADAEVGGPMIEIRLIELAGLYLEDSSNVSQLTL
jgi:hypothetical protein